MKINSAIFLAATLLVLVGLNLWAQQKKTETTSPAKPKKKVFLPGTYLGKKQFAGGPIKKDVLTEILKEGINSHDSSGNIYNVVGFNFNYAERRLYEDSAGDVKMLVDYSSEYCAGDTLSTDISSQIYDRIKPGDTVFFNQVTICRPHATRFTDTFAAANLKCVITK